MVLVSIHIITRHQPKEQIHDQSQGIHNIQTNKIQKTLVTLNEGEALDEISYEASLTKPRFGYLSHMSKLDL